MLATSLAISAMLLVTSPILCALAQADPPGFGVGECAGGVGDMGGLNAFGASFTADSMAGIGGKGGRGGMGGIGRPRRPERGLDCAIG